MIRTALALPPLALLVALCAASAVAQPLKMAAGPVEAPYSLTAGDGTGLQLVGLDARAVVDGPLAFTELHLTFKNPQPRTIEGHFKVTMPEGAAISRFAMMINGQWMEGEVVEKQAARRAYEDALHRRQDPALLEQDSGNTFTARVFPIPANAEKEIIVAWSHELKSAGEAYRLPLAGLPAINRLTLTALTAAAEGAGVQSSLGGTTARYQVSKVEKTNFQPDQDWVVFGGAIPAGGDALRAGDLAVARFVVTGDDAPEALAHAVVLFDTSASRAVDFEGRVAALAEFIKSLDGIGVSRVQVIAFDQYTEEVFDGAPGSFGSAALDALRRRAALGASSLDAAITALEESEGPGRRLIIMTDGMLTAGEMDMEKLRHRLSALGARGIERIDAVVDTTARDANVLDMLVTTDLPRPGKVVEGRAPLKDQLARLGRKTLGDLKVTVAGATWVWPDNIRGLQAGDTVVAFAELPAAQPLKVSLSGGVKAEIEPKVREAEQPLLERAWVAARIKRLEQMATQGDPDLRGALKQQVLNLSVKHRVLSPYTALVVLETENDYARFGIDRRALADILVVGATGVELMHRDGMALARNQPVVPEWTRAQPKRDEGRALRNKDTAPRTATAEAAAPGDGFAMDDKMAETGAEAGDAPAVAQAAPSPEPMPVQERDSDADEVAAAPRAAAKSVARRPADAEAEERSERRREAPIGGDTGRGRGGAQIAVDDNRPDPFPADRRPPPPPRPVQIARPEPTGESQGRRELAEIEKGAASLDGRMAAIDKELRAGRAQKALAASLAWRSEDVTDLLALVALGQSFAQSGNGLDAARAFGSVLDLYPSRADMRRFAGNWLERLGAPGLELAADDYRVALEQRPDHPSIYHALGMVLLRQGQYAEALDVLLKGIRAERVENRFAGVDRILQEDAMIVAAAWAAAVPSERAAIEARLQPFGLRIDDRSTLRFILSWETDANDVDFHIFDKAFNHAYYSRKVLASGGELYADITTGYGPECFSIENPTAEPYLLKAHYYRKGPMGHGAGKVQIIRHDGKGGIGIEDRPFVIMTDGAFVDLGKVTDATAPIAKASKAIAK